MLHSSLRDLSPYLTAAAVPRGSWLGAQTLLASRSRLAGRAAGGAPRQPCSRSSTALARAAEDVLAARLALGRGLAVVPEWPITARHSGRDPFGGRRLDEAMGLRRVAHEPIEHRSQELGGRE